MSPCYSSHNTPRESLRCRCRCFCPCFQVPCKRQPLPPFPSPLLPLPIIQLTSPGNMLVNFPEPEILLFTQLGCQVRGTKGCQCKPRTPNTTPDRIETCNFNCLLLFLNTGGPYTLTNLKHRTKKKGNGRKDGDCYCYRANHPHRGNILSA